MKNHILAALAVCCLQTAQGQTELIVNGGFEAATPDPWQFVGTNGVGVGVQNNPLVARSGSRYLSLGNAIFGFQGFYQMISIPTNAVHATLNYYWNVLAQNPGDSDFLQAFIVNTNLDILTNVSTVTSGNADSSYHQKTFDLTAFIGRTIGIAFRAGADTTSSFLTTFRIDDVSVMYVTAGDLPANDYFTNRIVLTNAVLSVAGTNTYATSEDDEPGHAGESDGKSLWWSWSTLMNGIVTVDTSGSSFDTVLAVYTGSEVTNLNLVAANDDNSNDPRGPVLTSRVKFGASAGVPYQIAVAGVDGAAGTIVLNVSFQPDLKAPSVTISSPASGAKLTNSTAVVQGKATDNFGVALVQFRLENAAGTNAYQAATGTNTWSATVTNLAPGLNTVRVRAFDSTSNLSATVTRSFKYVIVSPLTVTLNGSGTVSPNLNGQLLEIGASYKLTAKPATGQIFAGWTGDITSGAAALTFVMQSNLVLQANFIPNPFIPVAGTYQGLFYETNGVRHQSSGFFSAKVATSGSFSAKLLQAGKSYSFSGLLSATGAWSNSVARKGLGPLSAQLKLNFAAGALTGQLSDGSWTAALDAGRAVYSNVNPAPQAGKYTLLIPGGEDSSVEPGGDGFGAVTVNISGSVAFSGMLGDGTKAAQKAIVTGEGEWPFYVSLYSGNGSILGWLIFTNEAGSDLRGRVSWIKLAQSASKYYPAGFTNDIDAAGSAYRFTNGIPVLNFTTGQVWLANGNLPQSLTNVIALSAASKVTNLSSNKLSVTVTTSSGLFKGSMTDPVSGKAIPINGAVLQKLNGGYGVFLGTNETGRVYFGP